MISRKNFSGEVTPRLIDTEYDASNFSQPQPVEVDGKMVGVRLFPGDDTPRKISNSNLINCELPPGSTVINCNAAIIEFGLVSGSDDIIIDGAVIATEETKFNRVHGRYVDGVIEYKDIPEDIY